MRIIAGKFKGRVIRPPKGLPVRPTTDLAKEGLFNILANRVDFEDCVVLDCFAGTGAMSYEFASRGVPHLTTVDKDAKCVAFQKATFAALGMPNAIVVKMPVEGFLKTTATPYDIIFLDPPYDMPKQTDLLDRIFNFRWLAPGGVVILEHSSHNNFSSYPHFVEVRKYGNSSFSFFEYPQEQE
jgi:16S rRNA (guanine966-N2)-methyltransferase